MLEIIEEGNCVRNIIEKDIKTKKPAQFVLAL
jgi:hypothetical protein